MALLGTTAHLEGEEDGDVDQNSDESPSVDNKREGRTVLKILCLTWARCLKYILFVIVIISVVVLNK